MLFRSIAFSKIIVSTLILILSFNFLLDGFSSLSNNKLIVKNKIIKLQKNQKSRLIDTDVNNTLEIYQENEKDKNLKLLKKDNKKNILLAEKILIVKKNDTFSRIIDPFFETNFIKNLIIEKLKKEFDLRNLKIGQYIYLYESIENKITKIIIPINFEKEIIIKIKSDDIILDTIEVKTTREMESKEFIIYSSLYSDGIKAGIPLPILIQAIKLYSFDIDFQRDIKKNSKLKISFEKFYNSKRKITKYGNIEYINLIVEKKELEYFLFKTDEGFYEYFNSEGKDVKKSILKTPIDGARLSSNFGMRKHPISGYNKLHKGVDFAAKSGTPVYAGGNGVIEFMGNNGGYGKYIRIRHNNQYKTAYAHLSNFKKGNYIGMRVNQGDTIGFVGSTGNSTGPHLHYEIIFQNKQINPMTMKLPSGKILQKDELIRFIKISKNIYANYLFNLRE